MGGRDRLFVGSLRFLFCFKRKMIYYLKIGTIKMYICKSFPSIRFFALAARIGAPVPCGHTEVPCKWRSSKTGSRCLLWKCGEEDTWCSSCLPGRFVVYLKHGDWCCRTSLRGHTTPSFRCVRTQRVAVNGTGNRW